MTITAELDGICQRWARAATRADPDRFDDAAQEARIAVWQAQRARPDAPLPYLAAAARNGARILPRGRKLTGAASRQGKADAMAHALHLEPLIGTPGEPRAIDPAAYADTRQRVRLAVRALAPADRELVYLRYWQGRSFAECATVLGRPEGTLSRRWATIIRPALARTLQDLRED